MAYMPCDSANDQSYHDFSIEAWLKVFTKMAIIKYYQNGNSPPFPDGLIILW